MADLLEEVDRNAVDWIRRPGTRHVRTEVLVSKRKSRQRKKCLPEKAPGMAARFGRCNMADFSNVCDLANSFGRLQKNNSREKKREKKKVLFRDSVTVEALVAMNDSWRKVALRACGSLVTNGFHVTIQLLVSGQGQLSMAFSG